MILLWNFRFLCERLRFRTARRRVELFSHHEINRRCHNGLVPQAAAHCILFRMTCERLSKIRYWLPNLARMLYISVCFFFGSRRKVRKFAQYGSAYGNASLYIGSYQVLFTRVTAVEIHHKIISSSSFFWWLGSKFTVSCHLSLQRIPNWK